MRWNKNSIEVKFPHVLVETVYMSLASCYDGLPQDYTVCSYWDASGSMRTACELGELFFLAAKQERSERLQ